MSLNFHIGLFFTHTTYVCRILYSKRLHFLATINGGFLAQMSRCRRAIFLEYIRHFFLDRKDQDNICY